MLLQHAELVAGQTQLFLDGLATEPDQALVRLRTVVPVLLAQLVEQARLLRNQLPSGQPDQPAMGGEAVGLAQALQYRDPASLPYLRDGAPVETLGPLDVVRPLEGEGLWPGWELAGWTTDLTVAVVCRGEDAVGRVELVGGHWLAAHGTRYLHEGVAGPLLLHGDPFSAARSVAVAAQAVAARTPSA
jgi:hypothetical protein